MTLLTVTLTKGQGQTVWSQRSGFYWEQERGSFLNLEWINRISDLSSFGLSLLEFIQLLISEKKVLYFSIWERDIYIGTKFLMLSIIRKFLTRNIMQSCYIRYLYSVCVYLFCRTRYAKLNFWCILLLLRCMHLANKIIHIHKNK